MPTTAYGGGVIIELHRGWFAHPRHTHPVIGLLLLIGLAGHPATAVQPDPPLPSKAASVQDIETGHSYPSGTRVQAPLLGISFVVPVEWRGAMPAGSQIFLLRSTTKQGVGMIVMLQDAGREEIVEMLDEPQVLEEGFVLHPAASPVITGDRISATYHAGEQVGRALATVGPSRHAVIFLFIGLQEHTGYYDGLLHHLVASTRFGQIDTAPVVREWQTRLSGMMLKRITRSGSRHSSLTATTIWNLCRDGRYTYSHSSNRSHDGAGTGASDGENERSGGTWRVEIKRGEAVLTTADSRNLEGSYPLAFDGSRIYLDGEPVFLLPGKKCSDS